MRVLIAGVTYSPSLNGQAIFTTNLAEGLVKHGHTVLVAFPTEDGISFPQQRNGVRLSPLKSISLGFVHEGSYAPIVFERTMAQIFDDFQPDIVHIQDHYPQSVSVVKLAQQRGIKMIGTNHFMPENLAPYIPILSKIRPMYDWLSWRWVLDVYNRVDVVTAQSEVAAEILRSQGLQRPIHPISCGIDLQHFYLNPDTDRNACRKHYGLDPAKIIFLFVGRVDREKRIDTLIRAFHLLSRKDIELAIAGKGAALEDLKELAEDLNQSHRVHFLGPIPPKDLPALLNSTDIFAMPSTAELLSLATLEAMACGRPVLLANAGALSSLVKHNINGYLFEPEDAEDAARYMELLAEQRHRWEEMGNASRTISQSHSLEQTISQYETLYEGLLGNTHPINPGSLPQAKEIHTPEKITKRTPLDLS